MVVLQTRGKITYILPHILKNQLFTCRFTLIHPQSQGSQAALRLFIKSEEITFWEREQERENCVKAINEKVKGKEEKIYQHRLKKKSSNE